MTGASPAMFTAIAVLALLSALQIAAIALLAIHLRKAKRAIVLMTAELHELLYEFGDDPDGDPDDGMPMPDKGLTDPKWHQVIPLRNAA